LAAKMSLGGGRVPFAPKQLGMLAVGSVVPRYVPLELKPNMAKTLMSSLSNEIFSRGLALYANREIGLPQEVAAAIAVKRVHAKYRSAFWVI